MKCKFWECKTHECGSFKFNNLSRHEMPWCELSVGYTHVNSHKTWHNPEIGGHNGDISRKFYKDWDKYCLELQQKKQRAETWKKQVELNEENVDYHRENMNKFLERLS